jgi:hypothetical protein
MSMNGNQLTDYARDDHLAVDGNDKANKSNSLFCINASSMVHLMSGQRPQVTYSTNMQEANTSTRVTFPIGTSSGAR